MIYFEDDGDSRCTDAGFFYMYQAQLSKDLRRKYIFDIRHQHLQVNNFKYKLHNTNKLRRK
jgi:hypothetical protein